VVKSKTTHRCTFLPQTDNGEKVRERSKQIDHHIIRDGGVGGWGWKISFMAIPFMGGGRFHLGSQGRSPILFVFRRITIKILVSIKY